MKVCRLEGNMEKDVKGFDSRFLVPYAVITNRVNRTRVIKMSAVLELHTYNILRSNDLIK